MKDQCSQRFWLAPSNGAYTYPVEPYAAEVHHFYEIDRPDPEAVFQSMTPMVAEHIGATDTHAWKAWAMRPELVISYVNSFRKLESVTS